MRTVMRSSAKKEVETIVVQTVDRIGPHANDSFGAAKHLPPQGSVHWRREIHPQRQAECNVRTTPSNMHTQRETHTHGEGQPKATGA